MARTIVAEVTSTLTCIDITTSGFPMADQNGHYIVPLQTLVVSYNNETVTIKQNGHTLLCITSADEIDSINGSTINTLDEVVTQFRALL